MTTDEILRLLRLAADAIGGPWFVDSDGYPDETWVSVSSPLHGSFVSLPAEYDEASGGGAIEHARPTAEYIAACDPTTIAALCRANLRLVAMEDAMAAEREWNATAPGYLDLLAAREDAIASITKRTAEILASMEKGNG